MATTDYNPAATIVHDAQQERDRSRQIAERYRCPFVDLNETRIDPELFRTIPAELMFRFNFVPLEARDNQLIVAVADPRCSSAMSCLCFSVRSWSLKWPLRRKSAIC